MTHYIIMEGGRVGGRGKGIVVNWGFGNGIGIGRLWRILVRRVGLKVGKIQNLFKWLRLLISVCIQTNVVSVTLLEII